MTSININKNIGLLLLATALLSLGSCAPRIPFTQELREQHRLTPEEIQGIQFYTSHDIILRRGEQSSSSKETSEGKLTVKSGKSLETVVIPAGTPGVVKQVFDSKRIAVSFEDDGSYLVFGEPRNKKGMYKLLAAEWEQGKGGKLQYGDKTYYATNESSHVFLQFKMKNLHEFRKQQRVVKGKKLE